jgi:hypothetical protein
VSDRTCDLHALAVSLHERKSTRGFWAHRFRTCNRCRKVCLSLRA